MPGAGGKITEPTRAEASQEWRRVKVSELAMTRQCLVVFSLVFYLRHDLTR